MSEIAVLIPCYNESITIKKVIEDYKKALPEAQFMCMTIIQQMARMKLQEQQVR